LATTFFYLSTYPKVYERLAHEIRSTFTTAADIKGGPKLSGCTYLRAFLEETVRINPPVGTTLWRNLPADAGTNPVIIDGHHITPGTTVGVNIYSIHHNAEYFPDPFSFKPERWLPECSDPERLKIMHDAFTAFSMGYRGCAGKAMAYLETELVVAKALWYFDFERAGGDDSAVDEGSGPVFRTEDQFGSRHSGPRLVFRPRGGPVGELLAKEQS
jgi:cytochrome P450